MEAKVNAFVKELASRPGNEDVNSIWYCVAACAFAGCNEGTMVPLVYKAAIARYPNDAQARKIILRRLKEALINGSFVFGDPRLLNAFYPLAEAIPDKESIDDLVVRKDIKNPYDLTGRGEAYMERVFGADDMQRFTKTMDEYWPDLRKLIVNYCYGSYQSERAVLTELDTSRISLASLYTMDCPKQLSWHIRGFMNLGGTHDELIKTLDIAKAVVEITDVRLKNEIPDVDEAISSADLVTRKDSRL